MDRNTQTWSPYGDPFGVDEADTDPDGDGQVYTLPMRFPGQYYDGETGLHYNYFRDYEPTTGRYIQSDPIGLRGGINSYAYANSAPLTFTDKKGLVAYCGRCATVECLLYESNRCPPPEKPVQCDGKWVFLNKYFFQGALQYFVCWCRWACKKCDGTTGVIEDTYGQPFAPDYGKPEAFTTPRVGGMGGQRLQPTPGDCACVAPDGGNADCKLC